MVVPFAFIAAVAFCALGMGRATSDVIETLSAAEFAALFDLVSPLEGAGGAIHLMQVGLDRIPELALSDKAIKGKRGDNTSGFADSLDEEQKEEEEAEDAMESYYYTKREFSENPQSAVDSVMARLGSGAIEVHRKEQAEQKAALERTAATKDKAEQKAAAERAAATEEKARNAATAALNVTTATAGAVVDHREEQAEQKAAAERAAATEEKARNATTAALRVTRAMAGVADSHKGQAEAEEEAEEPRKSAWSMDAAQNDTLAGVAAVAEHFPKEAALNASKAAASAIADVLTPAASTSLTKAHEAGSQRLAVAHIGDFTAGQWAHLNPGASNEEVVEISGVDRPASLVLAAPRVAQRGEVLDTGELILTTPILLKHASGESVRQLAPEEGRRWRQALIARGISDAKEDFAEEQRRRLAEAAAEEAARAKEERAAAAKERAGQRIWWVINATAEAADVLSSFVAAPTVSTKLATTASLGSTELDVADDRGIDTGDLLIINNGAPNEEMVKIANGTGGIVIDGPLLFSHHAGESVDELTAEQVAKKERALVARGLAEASWPSDEAMINASADIDRAEGRHSNMSTPAKTSYITVMMSVGLGFMICGICIGIRNMDWAFASWFSPKPFLHWLDILYDDCDEYFVLDLIDAFAIFDE